MWIALQRLGGKVSREPVKFIWSYQSGDRPLIQARQLQAQQRSWQLLSQLHLALAELRRETLYDFVENRPIEQEK